MIPRPSLHLNFAKAKALDPRVTFSRASTATYFDKFGVLKTAAVNEPRFDHDPLTGESLGLLVEAARTNLLTYSAIGPAGTGWTAVGTSTRTYGQADPMGGTDAVLFDDQDAATIAYLRQVPTIPNDSATYTASVFAKAGSTGKAYMRLALTGGTAAFGACIFDFATKTWTFAGSITVGGYEEVGNGWFRLWLQITNNSTGNTNFDFRIGSTDTDVASTGTVYLWGAQIETTVGGKPSSYIPTTTAAVTRAADLCYLDGVDSYLNPNEGSLVLDAYFTTYGGGRYRPLMALRDTAATPANSLYVGTTDSTTLLQYRGGLSMRDPSNVQWSTTEQSGSSPSMGSPLRHAVSWDASGGLGLNKNIGATVFGKNVLSASAGGLPQSIDRLVFNDGGGINYQAFGHALYIQRFSLYRQRVSEADLMALLG